MSGSGTSSCIVHPERTPLVMVRKEFIDICDGDIAAAILLSILEYWTNVKMGGLKQLKHENANRRQAGMDTIEESLWIYKSGEEFQEDGLGLLKEHDVARGLKVLLAKGFIHRRHNPKFKWDRKWQYLLDYHSVNKALCIPHICGMDNEPVDNQSDTGSEAITETTTETTSKNTAVVVVEPEPQKQPQPKVEEPLPPHPNIYKVYEQEIGVLTPMIADVLDDIDKTYPEGWFVEAVREAKKSSTRVSIKYVEKILQRWLAEGKVETKKNAPRPRSTQPIRIVLPDGSYSEAYQ